MKQLISVDDAVAMVLKDTAALPAEMAPLHEAAWRVLAKDITALRTQPPFPAAAMDGYAVCDADARQGAELAVIGESAGSSAGLGHAISLYGAALKTPLVFASVLVLALMAIGLFGLIALLERLLMPWRKWIVE